MIYTIEQVEIIKRMIELVKKGGSLKDPFIEKCFEYHKITFPLSKKYTQEELQEQQKDRERIQNELQELKDIPLEENYKDFGTFNSLYHFVMCGGVL